MPPRRVLVLGSNSFSGADFIELLLERGGFEVLGCSRSPEKGPPYRRAFPQAGELYRFLQVDVNYDLDRLFGVLEDFRPSWIVNFAAQSEVAPSWEHPEHWYQTNCVSLARLVNHLRQRAWVERYLQISSPEAYGTCVGRVTEERIDNPSTPYAASKSAADALLAVYRKQLGFPVQWVRSTNVYGAGQQLFKIIPRSVIFMKLGRKIPLHGGGRAIKSYIHVRDVSRGELAVLESGRVGERYHISPDEGVAVRDVVRQLAERLGRSLAEVSEDVGERAGQDAAYVIDSSKLRLETGWRPLTPLEQGLGEVVDWVTREWKAIEQEPLEYLHRA